MTVLTDNLKRQKEAVRKRGPSLREKALQMGLKGNIRVLVIYEDLTHGVWHVAKYCPPGLAFPDINGLVEEYDKTRQTPRVRLQDKQVQDDEAVIMSKVSAGSESADIEDMGSVDYMDGATDVAVTGVLAVIYAYWLISRTARYEKLNSLQG